MGRSAAYSLPEAWFGCLCERPGEIMLKLSGFILASIWSLCLKTVAYIFPLMEFYLAELEHWHQYRVGIKDARTTTFVNVDQIDK